MATRNLNVNPVELISMIKNGKNPQQLMLNILESNLAQVNPIAANLLDLAKHNRTAEIERVAFLISLLKEKHFLKMSISLLKLRE